MLHTLFDLPITLVGPAASGSGQWYYICVLPLAFVAPEAM